MTCCKVAPIRVLLIEDDDDDVALVQASLAASPLGPFTVVRARVIEEALVELAPDRFDVVLFDLSLPERAALPALAELRSCDVDVPVIVFSDEDHGTAALQALELGAQEFLIKRSAAFEVLPRVVYRAIASHRLTAELEASQYRLNLLAEQLPALLWTTDDQLRVTSWRGKCLSAPAPSPGDVVGSNVRELSLTDAQARRNVEMHVRAFAGESISGELNWAGKCYYAHLEPLKNLHGAVIGTIGVAVDVTHERKLMKDIAAAHQVQQHMLPSFDPVLPGFDISGACFPAEDCSGDFYDYIPLPEKRLVVVLADVSGHGFGPAIMASAVRSYLRTAAVLGHHVHEMLAICNRLLAHDSPEGPFATVFAARIDALAGSFQFTSAGHSAHLIRARGTVENLETASVPIGVVDNEEFALSRPILLHRGDILLLASDGLFESRNGERREMFGLARAVNVVRDRQRYSAREIVADLREVACEFSGGGAPADDLTAVVVKRAGAASADVGRGS